MAMALPIIWLGAAALATYTGVKYANRLNSEEYGFAAHPGELDCTVTPVSGSIVCCEVYDVLDHSGVWVGDRIIELNGNGLVRSVSPERFLHDRSGNTIYVACDDDLAPVVFDGADQRASESIFQYRQYDLLKNNCHTFVSEMVSSQSSAVTLFRDLNQQLAQQHGQNITWLPV